MLEMLLCSVFTILPDYLYRRYGEGKRLGVEIGFYSVWYELRYGITACLMLTIALITTIFYFHPSTTNVTGYFRTVPILPETNGRVTEVLVGFSGEVKKGQPSLPARPAKTAAALEVANRQIVEVDAAMVVSQADIAAAEGQIQQAKGAYQQALDELAMKEELFRRNPDVVAQREIERLRNVVDGRKGALSAAEAARDAAQIKMTTLLPAQKASAEAARDQADVELSKMTISAGIDGHVEQFTLRVGDVVNPFMRPAGILIPAGGGRRYLHRRLQSDRSSGDEGRNGSRGHLRFETADDHSYGRNGRPGFRRCWPSARVRATDRRIADHAPWHADRSSCSRSTKAGWRALRPAAVVSRMPTPTIMTRWRAAMSASCAGFSCTPWMQLRSYMP